MGGFDIIILPSLIVIYQIKQTPLHAKVQELILIILSILNARSHAVAMIKLNFYFFIFITHLKTCIIITGNQNKNTQNKNR